MNTQRWAQTLLAAHQSNQSYPSISQAESQMTLADAYAVQTQFVALRKGTISGFKAALTASQAQAAMDIDLPIVGALFADGSVDDSSKIKPNQPILLETEFGFCAAQDITHQVGADAIFEQVEYCMPMIELASPNLASKPNGFDLIATNSASYGYICGAHFSPNKISLDTAEVALHTGDQRLFGGVGGDVMGGQRQALAWLINNVLDIGYQIKRGCIFMTGSIGGMTPGKAGLYTASHSGMPSLQIEIVS